jgi:hypothetical protein
MRLLLLLLLLLLLSSSRRAEDCFRVNKGALRMCPCTYIYIYVRVKDCVACTSTLSNSFLMAQSPRRVTHEFRVSESFTSERDRRSCGGFIDRLFFWEIK